MEELRAFMVEFVHRHSLRYAEDITGIGHETIRKFIEGETARPHGRSRKAYTVLYWRESGLAIVADAGEETPTLWASELRGIFRGGREQALADVRKLFELAGRHPDELPDTAEEMERWWVQLLQAEYGDDLPYRKPRRGPRRGPPGDGK